MDELMDLIDKLSMSIMDNNTEEYVSLSNTTVSKIWEVFPDIISSYSMENMRDVSNDALIWPKLLEKLINALSGQDMFRILDVLSYEIKPQLQDYYRISRLRNIDI